MSYNVENFFDLTENGNEYPEYVPGRCNWEHETHARKLANIASAIAAANPDLVALQEIENANAAEELRASLRSMGRSYRHMAVGDKPRRTTTCPVLLSRFAIAESRGHMVAVPGGGFSRNLLEARVLIGHDTLTVFVCHWPSKLNPESWRVAAARVLANRIGQLTPGADYVLAGDFNAGYNEGETFTTEGLDDTHGYTGINHELRTVRSGPRQFLAHVTRAGLAHGVDGAAGYHYTLWHELPPLWRWSYRHQGHDEAPDHIIVPRSLLDSKGISYVPGSFHVFRWNGRLVMGCVPYRWQFGFGRQGRIHEGRGYSDHLPVVARFAPGPYREPDPGTTPAMTAVQAGSQGMETGFEGWRPADPGVHLVRDSSVARNGRFSLRVEGMPKRNATVARLVLTPGYFGLLDGSRIVMDLCGSGRICMRSRVGDGAWRYYDARGGAFAPSSRPSYQPWSSLEWVRAEFPLGATATVDTPATIEIRSGGGDAVRVNIDDVSLVADRRGSVAVNEVQR